MKIPSGVTDQYIYFVAVDVTDLKTRETGLSGFTVYRSRNGGVSAAMTTPTINETDTTNMPGVYELLLDEDMTIDAGDDSQEMCFHITHASMSPVTRTIELYRPKITAGNTLGVAADGDISGNLDGTVATVTTVTGLTASNLDATISSVKSDTAAILIDTGTTLDAALAVVDGNVDAILVDTGTTLDNHLTDIKGTGFVKDTHSLTNIEGYADLIDDGTSGLVKIATDVAAVLVDTNSLNDTKIPDTISLANINAQMDSALDTAIPASPTAGSINDVLDIQKDAVVGGLAQTGTLSTTQMTTDLAEATDDHYNGRIVVFRGGVLDGQATDITDYSGTNGLITMTAITEAPLNNQAFIIV